MNPTAPPMATEPSVGVESHKNRPSTRKPATTRVRATNSANLFGKATLEEPLLRPQRTERSDIGDRKAHAKLILGAGGSDGEAPVLDAEAATIGVVADLRACVDEVVQAVVVDVVHRGVPSAAVEIADSDERCDLVRCRRERRRRAHGGVSDGGADEAVEAVVEGDVGVDDLLAQRVVAGAPFEARLPVRSRAPVPAIR